MLVAEYTAKFDQLARFATSMISTDEAQKLRFMHELRVDIVKQVDSGETRPRGYADAI